jgi:hypothetical protein
MLNLKELEKKLDLALAKENDQSLTEWLLNLRKDNLSNFLGAGCIENLKAQSFFDTQTKVSPNSKCITNNDTPENDYRLAA